MLLAVVIPSIILAYLGLLKEFFLFPLGTLFLALTDSTGPFHRRRNALIVASGFYFFVSLIAGLLKDFPPLIFLEIIILGCFYHVRRLRTTFSSSRFPHISGFSHFIDGAPGGHSAFYNALVLL